MAHLPLASIVSDALELQPCSVEMSCIGGFSHRYDRSSLMEKGSVLAHGRDDGVCEGGGCGRGTSHLRGSEGMGHTPASPRQDPPPPTAMPPAGDH